jgi:hypothetical protein
VAVVVTTHMTKGVVVAKHNEAGRLWDGETDGNRRGETRDSRQEVVNQLRRTDWIRAGTDHPVRDYLEKWTPCN